MGRAAAWSAIRPLAAVLVLAAVLGLAWPGSRAQGADDPPTVTTDKGVVDGSPRGNVAVFLGVPYAAPTGGDNRFRPPQPREPWSTPFDATKLATPCAQGSGLNAPGGSTNEDCLVVNVSAPRGLNRQRPVMVYLHGGGNLAGTSNKWLGVQLVAQSGVVAVSLNYRLASLASSRCRAWMPRARTTSRATTGCSISSSRSGGSSATSRPSGAIPTT